MTPTTRTAAIAAPSRHQVEAKPFLLRLLDGIAAADARYRERQALARMEEHRLEDMGIVRDADGTLHAARR